MWLKKSLYHSHYCVIICEIESSASPHLLLDKIFTFEVGFTRTTPRTTLTAFVPPSKLSLVSVIGWDLVDGSGCRNAKLVAGSSGRVDLTQRQAVERTASVSVNRSQVLSDHTRQDSANGRDARIRIETHGKDLRIGASLQSA